MKKFVQNIFNTGSNRNICIGNGNVINGGVAVNCVVGDNITMVNGKVISGNIKSINGVSMKQAERSFRCTAERDDIDALVFSRLNNCSAITIISDENVDRITAEVKTVCYAPDKEQAEKVLENFGIKITSGSVASTFAEIGHSEETLVSITTEYKVRVPKSVTEIFVEQTTSDVKVAGFEGMLSLKASTGSIVVTDCTLKKSKIKVSTGNISFIDNIVNKDVDLKSSTGNIRLSVKGGKGSVNADTSTGNIYLLNENFDVCRRANQSFIGETVFAEVNDCSITATAVCGEIKR